MAKKIMPPVHPGEILREEFLTPLGVTPNHLATRIHVPSQRIYEILAGKRSITLDTALRLGRYFGTSAKLWMGLQLDYDREMAEDSGLVERVMQEVSPMPMQDCA